MCFCFRCVLFCVSIFQDAGYIYNGLILYDLINVACGSLQ